MKFPGNTHQRP